MQRNATRPLEPFLGGHVEDRVGLELTEDDNRLVHRVLHTGRELLRTPEFVAKVLYITLSLKN